MSAVLKEAATVTHPPRPTGEVFDAKKAVQRTVRRLEKVMDRLAQ